MGSFTKGFSGPKSYRDFRETGPRKSANHGLAARLRNLRNLKQLVAGTNLVPESAFLLVRDQEHGPITRTPISYLEPSGFSSAGERPERLWDNGLELFFRLVACITVAVRQEVGISSSETPEFGERFKI